MPGLDTFWRGCSWWHWGRGESRRMWDHMGRSRPRTWGRTPSRPSSTGNTACEAVNYSVPFCHHNMIMLVWRTASSRPCHPAIISWQCQPDAQNHSYSAVLSLIEQTIATCVRSLLPHCYLGTTLLYTTITACEVTSWSRRDQATSPLLTTAAFNSFSFICHYLRVQTKSFSLWCFLTRISLFKVCHSLLQFRKTAITCWHNQNVIDGKYHGRKCYNVI